MKLRTVTPRAGAALLLLGFFAALPALRAAMFYVATSGSDANAGTEAQPFRTIQKGVAAAQPGDTVYIRGGTYVERVTMTNSGTAQNKIVVSGYPGEDVVIDGENRLPTGAIDSAQWTPMFSILGSHIELRNLAVTRSRGRGVQVSLGASGFVLLANLKVSYTWNVGIMLEKTSHVTVENCEVWECVRSNAPPNRGRENWSAALGAANSDYTTIRGCNVHENHGEGIFDLRSDYTLIEGCVAWDNYKINIYLDNSQYSTVRRNLVYATDNRLFWRYGDSPTPGIIISNEVYTGNSRYPNFAIDNRIYNNFIYNTRQALAIWDQNAAGTFTRVSFAHNTVVSMRTGPEGNAAIGFQHNGTSNRLTGIVVKNNIFSLAAGSPATGSTSGITFSHNHWSGPVPAAFASVHDSIGDPQLQLGAGTPAGSWLKLTAASPAIGRAEAMPGIATDFFGSVRDERPDIGAHEFDGVVAPGGGGSGRGGAATARIANLSVLTSLDAAGADFTVGFAVGGANTSGVAALLIRAAGPSLAGFGIAEPLGDPALELFSGTARSGGNDNWGGDPSLAGVTARVGAFAFAAPESKDAALHQAAVPPGSMTVRISGAGPGTGAVMAEIYDATPPAAVTGSTPRLVNVSVLKLLGAGSGLSAGFVIAGSGAKTVLIRAVGPGLAVFGLSGGVREPRLALFRAGAGGAVATNAGGWGGAPPLRAAFLAVGAFDLPPNSRDAALLLTLEPGNYVAQANAAPDAGGMVLLEVYEVP